MQQFTSLNGSGFSKLQDIYRAENGPEQKFAAQIAFLVLDI